MTEGNLLKKTKRTKKYKTLGDCTPTGVKKINKQA